ncbi:MAG: hypothetical protein NC453_15405 [Muribaculum sp.]|nr:hypothetical protein [Muribaculum sp.]
MLKLISHNPFRILGVFGNASKKDIVSSENKIKAFLKVDKDIQFPLDSVPNLPTINRELDSLSSAMKELERPIDELKSLLFWFIEQTPIDKIAFNHLTSGNIHKAIDIWTKVENLSSSLNLLTSYTILEDWENVAECADGLLSNYNYVEDICKLVSDTIQYDSPQMIKFYLAAICEESPVTLWKIYRSLDPDPDGPNLEDRGTTEWNFQIREVLASYFVQKTENQLAEVLKTPKDDILERARKMHQLLKQIDWEARREVMGNGVEFSRLKDKVASEGIQIAINLYNNSDEPSQVARMSLELAQLALNTSVKGSLVYQRCEENVNTLKDICSELPPIEVVYYDKLLKPIIEAYQNKPSTIGNANDFINACAPYLMSIRTAIGANNKYYIKICTRIAEDALSDIISDYNEQSERLHNRLENSNRQNRSSIIKSIQEMMKKAVIAMYHLKFLGLDPAFKTNRFDNNYAIIVKQARGAQALGASSIHAILGGEVSESDFNNELKKYPLDQRDEDAYFKSIKSLNDCYLYRKLFLNGKYAKQIALKVEEYEYTECATLEDLMKFKVRYPSTQYDLEKKREEIIFKSCKTIEDYQAYLSKYNTYKDRAISRIDDLRFEHCKNRDDYAYYLKNYPNGSHRLDAQRKLDELDYGACKTLQDFERYLQNYPNGFRASDARKRIADEKAWQECVKKNSWKAYKEYLSKFPYGRHSSEAKPKAVSPSEKFKKWRENNGCLFTIIIIAAIVLIIAGITNGVLGIGYVFGAVAACGVFGSMGKGDIGCGTRIAALGIGVVAGLIAAGLISWGEELERENKAEKAINSLPSNPSVSDYQKLFSQYGSQMDNSTKQELLEQYYNASLDSCYSTIYDYSSGGYNSTLSGLGYIKKFAETCHDSSYRDKAELRYSEIVDSLYVVAKTLNTYDAWTAYQGSVPSDDYRDSQEKKDAADTKWSTDNSAWQTASSLNNIAAYQKYLDLYPYGKHKSTAESKLIDLQVDATFAGEHGYLPEMDKTSYGGGSTSTISVYNNTSYTLTLLYSGKESKKLVLSPNSRGSLRLKNGSYRIAASVSASNVQRYAGSETLNGGGYEVEYYISTTTVPSYRRY